MAITIYYYNSNTYEYTTSVNNWQYDIPNYATDIAPPTNTDDNKIVVFDPNAKVWNIIDNIEPTRQKVLAQLQQAYSTTLYGGYASPTASKVLPSDISNLAQYQAILTYMDFKALTTYNITATDGSSVTVTVAQLTAIIQELQVYWVGTQIQYNTYLAQVNNATSVDELLGLTFGFEVPIT